MRTCEWFIIFRKGGHHFGVVNADFSELISVWNHIKSAISSIEETKASVNKKYQQLGSDWKDRKYTELGYVVQECNHALNDISNILAKSERYISSLAQSLRDYESVNFNDSLEGDNAFLQGLRYSAGITGQATPYQYCLGVLTKGVIPEGYVGIISNRHQNACKEVKQVFDDFANQLQIKDANYPPNETAHYCPNNYPDHSRGVYYNAQADLENPRGAGTTFFHELAHMIDHYSTGYQGNLSNTAEFGEALRTDGQNILTAYNSLSTERQTAFLNRIRQDNAHSFSDLIDATTNGQLHGAYGHSREYWSRSGNLQAEAFAHFFEASMGSAEKLQLLASFFPNAFGVFSSLINSITSDNNVLSLSLGRSR